MSKDGKSFWEGAGKFIAVLALFIASISLVMTLLSRRLESNEPQDTSDTVVTNVDDSAKVIHVLAAGSAVYGSSGEQNDYSNLFSGIRTITSTYEFAAYGQQSLIGTDVAGSFADSAIASGFNMAGLANPYAMSHGKEGIDASMAYWQSSTAYASGTNISTDEQSNIRVVQANGISCAFLSFTDTLNDPVPENEAYLVNVWSDEQGAQLIQKARSMADVVIVDVYWDGEDQAMPTQRQQSIARIMADAGASVIIGNAPQAIQPVQWIDDTLIFYSLGNLINDESGEHIGALGAVTITSSGIGDAHRIELTNPKVDFIASVSDSSVEDGYTVKLLAQTSDSEIPSHGELYNTYSSIIQKMDDSIRIGGLQ